MQEYYKSHTHNRHRRIPPLSPCMTVAYNTNCTLKIYKIYIILGLRNNNGVIVKRTLEKEEKQKEVREKLKILIRDTNTYN